ncbi:hypothetical protein FQN53_005599 [Emmonsiellopsis sp. PD_33]|nr:hypothetical protein FQN53_005599 [Emmonsiellopsis sp. PD_33]
MLVNLGLTADAAAAHKHEFSNQPNSQSNGSLLYRSSAAMLPLRFMSSTTRRSIADALKPVVPTSSSSQASSPNATPRFSSEEDYAPVESTSPSDRTDDAPPVPTKRHSPRQKSSFRFAYPPPSQRHKLLRIRPKLLLQLQQVSQTARPIPILDVMPPTLLGVTRKLPMTIRGLCPNDLVLVTSDSYEQMGADDDKSILSEDGPHDQREVVATLCQHRKEDAKIKGLAEICLLQGSRWEASRLPSGGYEFAGAMENDEQICVRWILRGKGSRRASGSAAGPDNQFEVGKRFTFSIIDPTTRRHPVIAWMSRLGIDVLDRYPLSSAPPAQINSSMTDDTAEPTIIDTDDHLRSLIIASGIWVAFQEGWPESPVYADPAPPTPTTAAPRPRSQPSQATETDAEPTHTASSDTHHKRLSLLRLGSPTLLHRSKSTKTDSQKSQNGASNKTPSKPKGSTGTSLERPGGSKRPILNLPDEQAFQQTAGNGKRRPTSRGDQQYLSATSIAPSPSRSSYGDDSQRGPLSSPPSLYEGQRKPDRSKGKRWRRLSNWLDFGGKKEKA